jgi:hypothetical protein
MKGVHWLVWVTLFVLFFMLVVLVGRKEKYAAPRDQTTQPPFVEPPVSNVVPDSQMDIYKDMGGLDVQIQAGNPILNFIQGDPSSNVIYGDFVPLESLSGTAHMYDFSGGESNVVPMEGTRYDLLNPVSTNRYCSKGDQETPCTKQEDCRYGFKCLSSNTNVMYEPFNPLPPVPENPPPGVPDNGLPPVPENPPPGVPDNGLYLPELTSPVIPFLGDTLSPVPTVSV